MFISHFNRYFEKHAKVTYLVLLIVIIATFVIFVTPGDVFRGGGRVTDIGEMYGKKLNVDQMKSEFQKTTVGFWLQYPQYFGRDLGFDNDVLLQQTLMRMRLLHEAKSLGLAKVADQEVKDAIAKCPVFFEDGKFSPELFKSTLDALNNAYGMLPAEFDDVVRENIIIERVQNKVTDAVTVSDDEINSALAQYSLKCATILVDGKAADPTEEDIQDFFKNRSNEIQLPETKDALVAVFYFDALKAKANEDAELSARITPSQEEIQRYFDTNGARLFAGKQLSEVTSEITNILLDEKVRAEARRRALALSRSFATVPENEDAEQRSAHFEEEAVKAGATVTRSEVATENLIKGMTGEQPYLANAIRKLAKVGDVTGLVTGTNYAAIAYVKNTQATPMPVELPTLTEGGADDYLRTTIRQMILREKALAFFQEQVKEPYEAYAAKVKEIEADKSMNTADKQQQLMALETTIDSQLVVKFFVPEKRDFVLATFAPDAYRDQVPELTEDDLRKVYEERKETYQKVKVRLGRIFVETDGLEGEALTAKEAKVAEVQQKLAADGADFLAIAKEYSEQTSQEDRTLRDLDTLSDALRAAVANLQAGQVSPVVKDARGSYIVKVLERQDGRAFTEVQNELKEELVTASAKRLADEDAAKLALQLSDQWWEVSEKNPEGAVPATLFEEALKAFPAAKLDSFTNVSPYDTTYPQEVMYKVFTAQEKAPITSNVVTDNGSYVAALTGTTEQHLSDPATDNQAYAVLLAAYRDAVQMEQALRTAQSERARLSAALVGEAKLDDVAAPLKFDDLPAISQNDITTRAAVVTTIENGKQIAISDLAAQLSAAQAGMVLEPIRAERHFNSPQPNGNPYQQVVVPMGYQLIYVAGIDAEAGKTASDEVRDGLRERMLAIKKSQALNDYMAQLEAQSNTRLRGE